jgi:hypothetical protein
MPVSSSDGGATRLARLEFRVYAVLSRLKAELRTAPPRSIHTSSTSDHRFRVAGVQSGLPTLGGLFGIGQFLIPAVVAALLDQLAGGSEVSLRGLPGILRTSHFKLPKSLARQRWMSARNSRMGPRSAISQASSRSARAPSASPARNRGDYWGRTLFREVILGRFFFGSSVTTRSPKEASNSLKSSQIRWRLESN